MVQKLLLPLAVAVAGDDAVVTRSGTELLEISAAGVTKASALAGFCASAGVAATEVVAIGDMVNDLSMLRWAGHAVAVASAHPDVLAATDEVIAGNDRDGVAEYLERLARSALSAARTNEGTNESPTEQVLMPAGLGVDCTHSLV